MDEKKHEALLKFITESDMEFYEEFLAELSDEEFAKFLEENPDFLKD